MEQEAIYLLYGRCIPSVWNYFWILFGSTHIIWTKDTAFRNEEVEEGVDWLCNVRRLRKITHRLQHLGIGFDNFTSYRRIKSQPFFLNKINSTFRFRIVVFWGFMEKSWAYNVRLLPLVFCSICMIKSRG